MNNNAKFGAPKKNHDNDDNDDNDDDDDNDNNDDNDDNITITPSPTATITLAKILRILLQIHSKRFINLPMTSVACS